MANSPQAIKRARQSEKHRIHNASRKSAMRTLIKKLLKLIAAGNHSEAREFSKSVFSRIDRLASQRLIHPNKAARFKNRLNKKVKSLA